MPTVKVTSTCPLSNKVEESHNHRLSYDQFPVLTETYVNPVYAQIITLLTLSKTS